MSAALFAARLGARSGVLSGRALVGLFVRSLGWGSAGLGWASFRNASLAFLSCFGAVGCAANKGDEGAPDWFAEAAPLDATEWTQYRRELRHRGDAHPEARFPRPASLAAARVWTSDPAAIGDYSAAKSSPTVAGEDVFIGVDDGTLRCLDRETGVERWRFRTRRADVEDAQATSDHHGIHGTAAVDAEGRVFIGDYSGWLYAIDVEDGSLLWERKLGGSIGASPVLHQGYIFIAVEFPDPDGQIFVVDAATGDSWYETPKLGNHPHSSVSIDPDRGWMWVGSNNGLLSAFDFVNRRPLWAAEMLDAQGDIKSTAAVGHGRVYITSWDHHLHVLDVESGARLWDFAAQDLSMSSPSLADGLVLFGSHDGVLYAVVDEGDPEADGALAWSLRLGPSIIASPTVVESAGLVFIGDNAGRLSMVDLATGELLDSVALDGKLSGVPVVVDGELYAADAAGSVWRFDAR